MRGRNKKRIELSEKFYSIQGEALSIGRPAFFIRFPLCNLKCVFCDTKYTWERGDDYHFHSLIKEIRKTPAKLVVITGGEPLLWQEQIKDIVKALPKSYQFEIETNGTLSISFLRGFKNVRYNVSPKLASSKNSFSSRYKERFLKQFLSKNAIFKFVIKTDEDWKEMEKIVRKIGITKDRVWIMPEGQTNDEVKNDALKFVDKIKKSGYNLSPRLQVFLWGIKRGK